LPFTDAVFFGIQPVSAKLQDMRLSHFLLFFLLAATARAQKAATENVVIITFDGLRWQEVFGGLDEGIVSDKTFTSDAASLKKQFSADTPEERRKKLLPFLWNTVATQGQLHGNRVAASKVNVLNRYWFSYPGYNEIFTGYPDTLINSNDKAPNKNITVLEYLNRQPALKGRVAVFSSWNTFDAIFNEKRAGFPVNAGFDALPQSNASFSLLNEMQAVSQRPYGDDVRPDLLTFFAAREYIKTRKPKVLYLSFDETDEHAHSGKYDQYLQQAHLTDQWIGNLWQLLQSLPQYRNKTTLIITTDHGRGDVVKKQWTDHGAGVAGADQIWMAFVGKGISALGEVKTGEQLYQAQLAQTIAGLLGYRYTAAHPIQSGINSLNTRK
jgi:hypothetical protein